MVRLEARRGKGQRVGVVVERRDEERVAHGLPCVLPALVKVVVIIVVAAAYLVGDGFRVVVVHGAALVGGVHELVDHGVGHGVVGQLQLHAVHAVAPAIFAKHHRVVLEEVVVVGRNAPVARLVVQA